MVQALVVSSAEMAKEVTKTNDLNFCTRPVLTGLKKISYDNKDLAFSPYSEYWRQMRKICMVNLFSVKHVNLFRGVRGTDTSAATVVWAMVLLIKNRPGVFKENSTLSEKCDREQRKKFEPERFMGSGSIIDYKGTDFELIPFGSGRRICPGIPMAAVTMEMTLSNLIYAFDWESPVKAHEIDTSKSPGAVTHKKNALQLMAKVYDHDNKN
ncbi:cytochrome P450 [Tanacetum coccineum]